jgi:hypothetical protein
MNHDLGEIIFERDFEATDVDGKTSHIKLRIGTPQLDTESLKYPENIVWFCPHQIIGIGSEKIDLGRGLDTLAALLDSLKMADAFLKFYARVHHKEITWKGTSGLGLPSSGYENIVSNT